jgi:hypothetical protein
VTLQTALLHVQLLQPPQQLVAPLLQSIRTKVDNSCFWTGMQWCCMSSVLKLTQAACGTIADECRPAV